MAITASSPATAGAWPAYLPLPWKIGRASIRQANTVIGEYEVLDDTVEAASDDEAPAEAVAMPEPARQHVSQQTLALGAGVRQLHGGAGETPDADEPGRALFSLQAVLPQPAHPDGKANGASPPARSPQSPKEEDAGGEAKAPPVPRPRLLLNRLQSR